MSRDMDSNGGRYIALPRKTRSREDHFAVAVILS